MYKDPTPIEHYWLMQMLGNFESKRNLYFIFSSSSPSKNRSRSTEGAYIYRRYKQFQHLNKKLEYCSQHIVLHYTVNVIIARQKYSAHLIYLSFSKFIYRKICFEAGI